MRKENDIRDNEIRIIGDRRGFRRSTRIWLIVIVIVILSIIVLLWKMYVNKTSDIKTPPTDAEPTYFEPMDSLPAVAPADVNQHLGMDVDADTRGFTELKDTTINDIPLRLFIPHNAVMTLHVGRMNTKDTNIIYAAQAADIRRDNGKILGAFVLKGQPLAWGLSKKGFCAVIDSVVTIGVADNTPLFETATEHNGYFFRQYPLVKDGVIVENEPKNKSERRAICDRNGEIFMVESLSRESFHDFSQALVDLNIDQAVYLVGSKAYGWAIDEHGERHEFGDDALYTGRRKLPHYTSYVVWSRK